MLPVCHFGMSWSNFPCSVKDASVKSFSAPIPFEYILENTTLDTFAFEAEIFYKQSSGQPLYTRQDFVEEMSQELSFGEFNHWSANVQEQ